MDPNSWPEDIKTVEVKETNPDDECHPSKNVIFSISNAAMAITDPESQYFKNPIFDATASSSYLSLLNVVCLVLRFCQCFKITKEKFQNFKISQKGLFTAQDHSIAEKLLLLEAQINNPPSKLQENQLRIFKDGDNLLRCQGRLSHSQLSIEAIQPIFLPKNHPLTCLIILFYHSLMLHSSLQTTLAKIRDKFWIPNGRQIVKSTIRKCMKCRRFVAKPYRLPNFPDLPIERVGRNPIFSSIGIDNLGPITVKINGIPCKLWVTLFTCLLSRAIHLEHVLELSSIAFVNALRRFVSRRGAPSVIYSDNATNFTLAEKSIKLAWNTIYQDEVTMNYFAKNSITWKFITPCAPWQGGYYERLVALVKDCLRKSIGRNQLDLESFLTLLSECEAVVNSRPLTYLYDEINCQVLRPADFIHPNMSLAISPLIEDHSDEVQ